MSRVLRIVALLVILQVRRKVRDLHNRQTYR